MIRLTACRLVALPALCGVVLLAPHPGPAQVPYSAHAASAVAPGTPPDYDIPGGHFFTEGSPTPNKGFSVTDQDGVPFWHAYLELGGPALLGYPISRRFWFGGTLCQATQHVILQWIPGPNGSAAGGHVQFLNLLQILHDDGKDTQLESTFSIPRQSDWSGDAAYLGNQSLVYQPHLALVEAVRQTHPAIVFAFYAGGIHRYGLPMAPVTTTRAGWVLRTQRAVLIEQRDGTPPHQVRLMDVGVYARDLQVFPRGNYVPQPPPVQPSAQILLTTRQQQLLAGDSVSIPGWLLLGTQPLATIPDTLTAQVMAQVIGPSGLPLSADAVAVHMQGTRFSVSFVPPTTGAYSLHVWLTGTYHGVPISRQVHKAGIALNIQARTWQRVYQRSAPWSYLVTVLTLTLLGLGLAVLLRRNRRRALQRLTRWQGNIPVALNGTKRRIAAADFGRAAPLPLLVGRIELRLARVLPGAAGAVRLSTSGPRWRRRRFGRWQIISPLRPLDVSPQSLTARGDAGAEPSLVRTIDMPQPVTSTNSSPRTSQATAPTVSDDSWG